MQIHEVRIPIGKVELNGLLAAPEQASGIVVFAHGSGSSRLSPRNQEVAAVLQRAGLATLLFDLLTLEEQRRDAVTAEYRFAISFLARRLEPRRHHEIPMRGQPAHEQLERRRI
ncbi:hypothetical protein QMA73_23150, partial [Burkholderia pseudomallei]|nr:hypothetical protein [Burkholderia pseudomallei]